MCLQTRYNTIGNLHMPYFVTTEIKRIGDKWSRNWQIERYYPGKDEFGLVYVPDLKLPKHQRRRKTVPVPRESNAQRQVPLAAAA